MIATFFLLFPGFGGIVWEGECSSGPAGSWSVVSDPTGTWTGACSTGAAGAWDQIDIDE